MKKILGIAILGMILLTGCVKEGVYKKCGQKVNYNNEATQFYTKKGKCYYDKGSLLFPAKRVDDKWCPDCL